MVTVAPGITAPVGSVTVPKMLPETAWPKAGRACARAKDTSKTRENSNGLLCRIIVFLHPGIRAHCLPQPTGMGCTSHHARDNDVRLSFPNEFDLLIQSTSPKKTLADLLPTVGWEWGHVD